MNLGSSFEQPPAKGYSGVNGAPLSAGKASSAEMEVVNEFVHLLEKSKQLFNGLRDLPQYGNKQWQAYFGRTFDVYTKLWKFQQQNRQILDSKYGLKRWQIGEIASKIGQLYYHYYLRTSDTNYLNESFSFYYAIRTRAYYSKASKEERPDLMVKKLRFFARFIVVCLLLKKQKLVRDIVRELAKSISDYSNVYKPDDQMEWNLVLGEIKAFVDADCLVEIIPDEADTSQVGFTATHRLRPELVPPLERGIPIYLTLQEVIIVGNTIDQIKFSELSLDMFRVLQTLERQPPTSASGQLSDNPFSNDVSPAPGRAPPVAAKERSDNPHKYLLYKPSFAQLLMFLSSGEKELPADGIILLYLSCDGVFSTDNNSSNAALDWAWEAGGVAMNRRTLDAVENSTGPHDHRAGKLKAGPIKDLNCLHPGDLYPFLRRPFFLVVDSETAWAFSQMPTNLFGQPLVCLMAPEQLPSALQPAKKKGGLFTLFLHCPLTAVCQICSVSELPQRLWLQCEKLLNQVMVEISQIFMRCRAVDHVYLQFYGDEFLRLLLLRFIFCGLVLRMHRGFKGKTFYPQAHPPLPEQQIFGNGLLQKHVLDLATLLDVRMLFLDQAGTDSFRSGADLMRPAD